MNIDIQLDFQKKEAIERIIHIAQMSEFSHKVKTAAIIEIVEQSFDSPAFNRGYESGLSGAKFEPVETETPLLRLAINAIIKECRAVRLTTELEERILNRCKEAAHEYDQQRIKASQEPKDLSQLFRKTLHQTQAQG